MDTLLVNSIEKNLSQFVFKNAIFLGERLCAEFPSEVNLQLLARCYLSNNQAYSAYYILKGSKAPQSRYLFALSCLKLDLLGEAEAALLPREEDDGEVPGGAAGHYLLGLIFRYAGRRSSSIEQFRMALSVDPLLWEAYEELCILGVAEEASTVFGEFALQRVQGIYLGQASNCSQRTLTNQFLDSEKTSKDMSLRQLENLPGNSQQDVKSNHQGAAVPSEMNKQTAFSSQANGSGWDTPSPVSLQPSDAVPPPLRRNLRAPMAEPSLVSGSGVRRRKFFGEEMRAEAPTRLSSETGLRRSARIAARRKVTVTQLSRNEANCLQLIQLSESSSASSLSSMIEKCRIESSEEGYAATTSGLSVGSLDAEINSKTSTFAPYPSSITSGVSDVLNLLRLIGEGHRLLFMYKCEDALLAYQKLSLKQYNTQWVLSQVGKAYFQLQDYFKADCVFSLAHQISPYALEGMDMYSTVLYHLKEEMKLSYLAQELISIDRLAPESWCAVGNCYSLQKDHETALKFFQRAVQLDQRFAYAHTLCGHEFAALEDYEAAEQCYRKALNLDARHYNAWYGLGMTYLHQEKYEFAEHYFQQALQINPQSSVIMCYNGIALHQTKRSDEALKILETAITADARNPLPRYYKANILVSLGIYCEAAEVLEELKDGAPCESSVHALLGKIYQQLKLYDKAVLHFGIALDLNPPASDAAQIKACMERLIAPDELEDDL